VRSPIKRFRDVVFQNFGWKVLSLGVAVVIWALVASEPELTTFTTVRLEYKNIPEDLDITSDPVESVVLELQGPSGELRGEAMRPAVVLDLAGVAAGERTFKIADGNVRLPRKVRLVAAKPGEVRLQRARRNQKEK